MTRATKGSRGPIEKKFDIRLERRLLDRFFVGASLPTQIFRDPETLGFLFTDSAILTARDLWPVLRGLASRFQDQFIIGSVVEDLVANEPSGDPLPILAVEPTDDAGRLRDWLDYTGPGRGAPLYIYGRVVALTGDQGRWGLWCDQDHEMAVLGVPGVQLGVIREWVRDVVDWPWYDATEVAELLRPVYYPDPVPEDLTRKYRNRFGAARLGKVDRG